MSVRFMPTASGLRAVGTPTVRAMPGKSLGPITTAPAPSPSRKEMDAVGGVDDVGELLGADHEGVVGDAGADQGVGLGDPVAVAGAGGVDVVGGGRGRADAVGDDGRHRRRLPHVADRGDDDGVDQLGSMPGLRDRLARGIRRQVDRRGRSAPARVRVMMPVRCWIHSSEESIGPTRSSLGTTRSPRAAPTRVDARVCGTVRLLEGVFRHARLALFARFRRPAR